MKCRLSKCKAQCCYNIPFENNELERFHHKIVNPVLAIVPICNLHLTMTSEKLEENKCPFLRQDGKCNIYENRPEICRMFGETERLPCKYLKK